MRERVKKSSDDLKQQNAAPTSLSLASSAGGSMLYPKLVFMFYYGGMALVAPYFNLFYKSKGLSGQQIGILLSLSPFIGMVAAPTLSALADRSGKRQLVLSLCIVISCSMRMVQSMTNDFYQLMLLVVCGELAGSGVGPIIDAITYSLLDNPEDYGKSRLFASIGWGGLAPLAGSIIAREGVEKMFPIQAIVLSLAIFFVMRIPSSNPKPPTSPTASASQAVDGRAGEAPPAPQGGLVAELLPIVRKPTNKLFFCLALALGITGGFINGTLFLYMDSLKASTAVMGLGLTVNCAAEVVMFWIAGKILKRFSVPCLLTLVFSTFAFRMAYYCLIPYPWLILLVESLNGVTFGIGWSACSFYVNSISPPHLKTTMQGLLAAVEWGFGMGVGLLVGGSLNDLIGFVNVFWVGVLVSSSGALLSLSWWTAEGKKAKGRLSPSPSVADPELTAKELDSFRLVEEEDREDERSGKDREKMPLLGGAKADDIRPSVLA